MTQIKIKDNTDKKLLALNKLSEQIIGIAFKIHNYLGPGFIEKIYEKAFVYELNKAGIGFVNQAVIKVNYEGLELGRQRVDFIIRDSIIVDLKCVSEILELHKAQILSYLKTSNKRLGLILNFGKKRVEIKRLLNSS